ncbi:MAG: ATP-binding protein [Bacteroidia bacterium]|nr:ATP-binding protein [Bacteroidia bacterium]MCX7763719.1 ATP-binding protein [Bacteroidia bacterium]MDW8057605.1 ATP-binding protein [Bacteroidia bacterium]
MYKASLQFGATTDNLPIIRHFVQTHLRNHIPSSVTLNQITVAIEELCANSILHGNAEDPQKELRLELRLQGDKLHIYLYDPAPPYDIHSYPSEPTLLRADTNRPGGFGIYLIRRIIDKIHIKRRRGGSSVYHMVKQLSHESKS